ncbi:MAG: hypothetical protein JW867_05510 [Candidatus Omnitrophica bacterium]|nr:hypothetical protein [Candidatus Omnitrophota bacterium]
MLIRAQSTLEYIVILTAVVLATLASRGLFFDAINRMFDECSTLIEEKPFP